MLRTNQVKGDARGVSWEANRFAVVGVANCLEGFSQLVVGDIPRIWLHASPPKHCWDDMLAPNSVLAAYFG